MNQLQLIDDYDLNGHSLALRIVKASDEAFLLQVYASTREEELALVNWDDTQKQAFILMQSHAQNRDYNANWPDAEYSLILLDNEPVGRIWIARDDKEIHLLDIALLTPFRNRGIGTVILQSLKAEAFASKLPLRHTVYAPNVSALRLYERLGFVIFDEQPPYYMMEIRALSGETESKL